MHVNAYGLSAIVNKILKSQNHCIRMVFNPKYARKIEGRPYWISYAWKKIALLWTSSATSHRAGLSHKDPSQGQFMSLLDMISLFSVNLHEWGLSVKVQWKFLTLHCYPSLHSIDMEDIWERASQSRAFITLLFPLASEKEVRTYSQDFVLVYSALIRKELCRGTGHTYHAGFMFCEWTETSSS